MIQTIIYTIAILFSIQTSALTISPTNVFENGFTFSVTNDNFSGGAGARNISTIAFDTAITDANLVTEFIGPTGWSASLSDSYRVGRDPSIIGNFAAVFDAPAGDFLAEGATGDFGIFFDTSIVGDVRDYPLVDGAVTGVFVDGLDEDLCCFHSTPDLSSVVVPLPSALWLMVWAVGSLAGVVNLRRKRGY